MAIATIPKASHRAGVTPAIKAPKATQESADRPTAAPCPARPLRSAQAKANIGTTSRASPGRAPCISQPSASAASRGTPTSATYVSACALVCSATKPMATKPITESAGTKAQRPLCKRAIQAGDQARGRATTKPWQSDSTAIESQNGIT